jgi:hypothetical protein
MNKLSIADVPVKVKTYGFGRYSVRLERYTKNCQLITYSHFTSKGKACLYFNQTRKDDKYDRSSLFDNDRLWMENDINGNIVNFLN